MVHKGLFGVFVTKQLKLLKIRNAKQTLILHDPSRMVISSEGSSISFA